MNCVADGPRARHSANRMSGSQTKTALGESKIARGGDKRKSALCESKIALGGSKSKTAMGESIIALGGSRSRTALDKSKRPLQQTTKTANHEDSLSFILASFPTDCYILSNGLSSGTCIFFHHSQRIALRNI